MLPPSGQEKRLRLRRAVEDGPVIRPQSQGGRHHCQRRRHCRRPHAPSPPFCLCPCPDGLPRPIPRHVLRPDGIVIVYLHRCPRRRRTASMTQWRHHVLPGMPPTMIVTRLEATDEDFCDLPPRCVLGVSLVSSLFAASPEDDVPAFVIDETALLACTRIRWGGVGVVEAPIADTSLADCLFWPSPSPSICTTGATSGRGGRAGMPPFGTISIASAMVTECFFSERSWLRRALLKAQYNDFKKVVL